MEGLNQKIRDKSAEINRLKTNNNRLKKRLEERDAEKDQMKKDLERLNFKVEEYEIEIKRLRKDLKMYKNQNIDNEMVGGYFFKNLS